jgi:hypothetical protein
VSEFGSSFHGAGTRAKPEDKGRDGNGNYKEQDLEGEVLWARREADVRVRGVAKAAQAIFLSGFCRMIDDETIIARRSGVRKPARSQPNAYGMLDQAISTLP